MSFQRIVFTEPYTAKLLEYEPTEPVNDQVKVKLVYSAISSGTERANLVGDLNISWTNYYETAVFPRYAGYSSSGIVEAVGADVTDLKPGDRVAMSWTTHCQYVTIPEKQVYKLPDNVSFEEGALFHIGTFPLAAIRKCRLEIGESAIVMGMGILGLNAVKLLRAAGAVPVIAVDPNPAKREKALSCGADYALDPTAEEFAKTVKAITGGGAKVGIEVTGVGQALDNVLDCMACFGRVALLGCTRNSDFTIDYYHKVHGPGITLIGAHTNARPKVESYGGYWTDRDDALALIKLVSLGRISLADMLDEIHSPAEAEEVYHRLAVEKSFPLVLFDWRKLQ